MPPAAWQPESKYPFFFFVSIKKQYLCLLTLLYQMLVKHLPPPLRKSGACSLGLVWCSECSGGLWCGGSSSGSPESSRLRQQHHGCHDLVLQVGTSQMLTFLVGTTPWTLTPRWLYWGLWSLSSLFPCQWRSGAAVGCQISGAGWWAPEVLGPVRQTSIDEHLQINNGSVVNFGGTIQKALFAHLVFLHHPLYLVVDFASVMGHGEVWHLAELVPADVGVLTEFFL